MKKGRMLAWSIAIAAQSTCALFIHLDDYPDAKDAGTGTGGTGAGAGGGATTGGGAIDGGCPPDASSDARVSATALGNGQGTVEISALAPLSNGHMIAAGYCEGAGASIDFGLGAGQQPCDPMNESMFLLWHDSALKPEWALLASATSPYSHIHAVAGVPNADDALVTGVVETSVVLGNCVVQSSAPQNLFIARIGHDGTCWWKQAGDSAEQVGHAIAVANGSVFVAGKFAGKLDFQAGSTGCVAPTCIQAAASEEPFFLAKLNLNGQVAWVKTLGGNAPNYTRARLAIDPTGEIWVAGTSTTQLFGCTESVAVGALGFVAHLTSDGEFVAARCFPVTGGAGALRMDAIAPDATGNVVAIGASVGGATSTISAQNGDIPVALDQLFALKMASNGDVGWAVNLGGSAFRDFPWSVATMQDGHFVATGTSFQNVVGTTGTGTGSDAYVVVLGPDGTPEWGQHYGSGSGDKIPNAVVPSSCANVIAGRFSGGLDPIQLQAPTTAAEGFLALLPF